MATLERTAGSCEGGKRQHVPYRIKWKCAGCGRDCEIDLSDGRYLSYPQFPGEDTVGLYCHECDHEETIVITTDIVISIKGE